MKTIKLKYPLENLTEIKMQRPKVKHLKTFEELDKTIKDDTEKTLIIFEMLTGIPKETLEELDIEDYNNLNKAFLEMLPKEMVKEDKKNLK